MHQHHIMLLGYLNNGQTEVAVHYLKEWMKDTSVRQSGFYTGCDTVDIMLQNKIAEAERLGIQMKMEIAVLFSPIKDTDMSVLIGNLLDNAIEAVKNLEGNERWIRLRMQTVNHIFIFEIKNPYAGNLKMHDGSYETTKADKSLHGFGLESVRKIVSANDGDVEIRHEQNIFSVCVTLFKNKDKNQQNSDIYE